MSHTESANAARLDKALQPGSLLAKRYRLIKKVGAGGMGSVWLAHDQSLDAFCAVKLVRDELVSNQEVRARFAREAKLAAQLRSPHVVDVFDYGESDDALYIAMAWLEGESLATRLEREGKLDAAATYRIVAHVGRALTSAHSLEIVHRDLKPDNVFLVPGYDEEVAKVLDFGIAHDSVYALHDHATREGSLLGTPCYLSPEQACGKAIDHRSDLWSLGVIAFECLTGHSPFDAKSIGEVIGRVLYEPLPMPTAFDSTLPPDVDEWWQQAASRDPDQRFQSAKELADELAAALGLLRSVSVPPPGRVRVSSFPGSTRASGIYSPASLEHGDAGRLDQASQPDDSHPSSPSLAKAPSPSPVPIGTPLPSFEEPWPPEPTESLADEQPPTPDDEPEAQPPSEEDGPRATGQDESVGLQDSGARELVELITRTHPRRFPKWLVVGLPVLLVLAGLAGLLLRRAKVADPSQPGPQQAPEASATATTKPVVRMLDSTEVEPVLPFDSLPHQATEGDSDEASSDDGAAVEGPRPNPTRIRPAPYREPKAEPKPTPSTRDYGI